MISWQVHGQLSPEDYDARTTEISHAWHQSGLLVAYELGAFPFPIPETDIAGVPWQDVYMRGRWGGAAGPTEFVQLLDWVVVNIWPYAKVAGAAAGVGFGAKAGADAWDLCKSGLKKGLGAILEKCARSVTVDIVEDSDTQHDLSYEIQRADIDTLDAAIEAIAAHAQAVHRGDLPRPSAADQIHWDGGARKLIQVRWDPSAQAWVPEDGD